MESWNERKFVNKWNAPGGLFSMKKFPTNISHYLYTYNGDPSVYDESRNLPYNLWWEKWRSEFYSTNMQSFSCVECVSLV